jgi:hypothetical protein
MAGMGIRVTPEQLQQVSARLDAGAAGIEGTLRELAAGVVFAAKRGERSHNVAVWRACEATPQCKCRPEAVAGGRTEALTDPLHLVVGADDPRQGKVRLPEDALG